MLACVAACFLQTLAARFQTDLKMGLETGMWNTLVEKVGGTMVRAAGALCEYMDPQMVRVASIIGIHLDSVSGGALR